MSKISSYDVFNKDDGDVISGVYNVTLKAGVGAASHGELSRITDVLRDFSVLRHPPLFLFENCVNLLIDVFPLVDTNYDNMLVKMV